MSNTAPKWLGILAVAALFGVVAWVASYVVFDFAAFAAVLVGAVVAAVTAVVLALGWRDAAPGPMGARDVSPASDAEGGVKAAAAAVASAASTAADSAKTAASNAAEATGAAVASATRTASEAASAVAEKAEGAAEVAASTAKAAGKSAAGAAKEGAAKAGKTAKTGAQIATKAAKDGAAKATKSAKATAGKVAEAAKPVAADGKPEMLSAPRGGAGDDLKQIKGVGPKMEKMLNTMGVWHFDQVASWRKKEVEWVDDNLEGFKGRVTRDEWVKQAKVLAKGGTTEFSNKVKKGGVY